MKSTMFEVCRVVDNLSDKFNYLWNFFFQFVLIRDRWAVPVIWSSTLGLMGKSFLLVVLRFASINVFIISFRFLFLNVYILNVSFPKRFRLDVTYPVNPLQYASVDFQCQKTILSPWKLCSLDSKPSQELFASQSFLQMKSIHIL